MRWGERGDKPVLGDYDRDGRNDYAVFRPSTGEWHFAYSNGGTSRQVFGAGDDKPVPGDYDGDASTDVAVWRPANGTWYVSRGGQAPAQQWGTAGDTPVPNYYDADAETDVAVWRASNGIWYVPGQAQVHFGQRDDIPIPFSGFTGGVVENPHAA